MLTSLDHYESLRKLCGPTCELGRSPIIDIDVIKNYPEETWTLKERRWVLAVNTNLVIFDMIEELGYVVDDEEWKSHLSDNLGITEDLIQRYPTKNWNKYILLRNPNITLDFISERIDYIEDKEHRAKTFSFNREHHEVNHNMTWDFISKQPPDCHPDEWDWGRLSSNPNITPEIITQNINNPWKWGHISKNPSVTLDFVKKFRDKPWNWKRLSRTISVDVIAQNLDLPWDWSYVSMNSTLTTSFIDKHPDKEWDWVEVSCNKNMDLSILKDLRFRDPTPEKHDLSVNRATFGCYLDELVLPNFIELILPNFIINHNLTFNVLLDLVSGDLTRLQTNIGWNSRLYLLALNDNFLLDFCRWREETHLMLTPETQDLIVTTILILPLPLELVYEVLDT